MIDRSNADRQNAVGGLDRLVRQTLGQVRVNIAVRQHARTAAGDPKEIGDSRPIDVQEGVKYGGHDDRSTLVRLQRRLESARVGLGTLPSLVQPEGVAERAASSGCTAELARQLCQKVVPVPARPRVR